MSPGVMTFLNPYLYIKLLSDASMDPKVRLEHIYLPFSYHTAVVAMATDDQNALVP